jgi:hypothetical protein
MGGEHGGRIARVEVSVPVRIRAVVVGRGRDPLESGGASETSHAMPAMRADDVARDSGGGELKKPRGTSNAARQVALRGEDDLL